MSEARHSPGPWVVGYHAMDVLAPGKKGGQFKVCDIRGWGYLTGGGHGALGLPGEEARAIQEANAALIAAAPDLLEALKRCVTSLEIDMKITLPEWGGTATPASDIGFARAAIAKGEGLTSHQHREG